jgi:anti-sigma-K factor RskA
MSMDEHDERDGHDVTDLAELRQIAERVRPGDVTWDEPPAELWDRIAAAVERPPTDVVTMRPRRRAWVVGLAAAAAAVVIAVAVIVVNGGGDDATVLATTTLDPLGAAGSGRAELVERDGALQLLVETDDVEAEDGYLELWMIDPTVTRLVSLGPLRPDGTYDVPDGVDPAQFPIVDVSAEPVDGDPTHSGDSLLRGQLPL